MMNLTFATKIPLSRWCAVTLVLAVFGCRTPLLREIPPHVTIDEAVKLVGRQVHFQSGNRRGFEVVLIRDRHPVSRLFKYVRPVIQEIQRDNRLLVQWLVEHNYGLLGCEYGRGSLLEDDQTKAQYQFVRQKTAANANLDRFRSFQAIRYQLLFGERIDVWGVEDPDLYERDVKILEKLREARRLLRYGKIENEATRERLLKMQQDALERIRENIHNRGYAAGRNLVEIMEALGRSRAILLVGGAHTQGALVALREAGISTRVVESAHYHDIDPVE